MIMRAYKTTAQNLGGYYPMGAENDPDAPWNQEDREYKDYEVSLMATLTRTAVIETDLYDMDGEIDLTCKEQVQLADEQHYGIESLLRILAERLRKDIERIKEDDSLTKRQKSQRLRVLESQLEDCLAWDVVNVEID